MFQVIVAISILLIITLVKGIPVIGGKPIWGLLLAAVATIICSGQITPIVWVSTFISGLDRLAWIIALAVVGGIMAEISVRLGTVDVIIGALSAKFGRHSRALVVSIMLVLCLAGSMLGDATASAAVVGSLTFTLLASMGIQLEKIAAIILMGCSIGSIMPPMTQGIALAATVVGIDPEPVVTLGYGVVGIILVLSCIYAAFFLVRPNNRVGSNPEIEVKEQSQSAGEILRKGWKSLLPVTSNIPSHYCHLPQLPWHQF